MAATGYRKPRRGDPRMQTEREVNSLQVGQLAKLEELTHELSNWVGMTLNNLLMADRNRDRMQDYLTVATGLSVRATDSLMRLMAELAEIRRGVVLQRRSVMEAQETGEERPGES